MTRNYAPGWGYLGHSMANKAPGEVLFGWRAFGTRKTFLQFTRKDATREDWRQAFQSRDLRGLRERHVVVAASALRRVGRGELTGK